MRISRFWCSYAQSLPKLPLSGVRRARQPSIMTKNRYGELPMTVLSPVRSIFRAVVSTVVPEAEELGEPGWRELETLVETTALRNPDGLMYGQCLPSHLGVTLLTDSGNNWEPTWVWNVQSRAMDL